MSLGLRVLLNLYQRRLDISSICSEILENLKIISQISCLTLWGLRGWKPPSIRLGMDNPLIEKFLLFSFITLFSPTRLKELVGMRVGTA
ncbi:hypothetical protein [Metallosphaera javensis (ex Sakai et al. 2022)]|uniref:hypothetical protein n=1 Tax=Metallosphaera javensis (ex Sakai et al. 2022) TaxID=2775498 RepID=UPI00258589F2